MANGHKSLRLGKHCVNTDFDIYGKIEMDERKKQKIYTINDYKGPLNV